MVYTKVFKLVRRENKKAKSLFIGRKESIVYTQGILGRYELEYKTRKWTEANSDLLNLGYGILTFKLSDINQLKGFILCNNYPDMELFTALAGKIWQPEVGFNGHIVDGCSLEEVKNFSGGFKFSVCLQGTMTDRLKLLKKVDFKILNGEVEINY